MFSESTETITLNVRTLVEFIYREGSIDQRLGGFDRAQLGAQLHRKIQKQAGPGYEAEVFLKDVSEYNGAVFVVSGRADGVIRNDTGVTVDEIKSTGIDLDLIETGKEVHWAQAKCYGWFLAKAEDLKQVPIHLTYVHFETKEIKIIERIFTYDALKDFYESLLAGWLKWVQMQSHWKQQRDQAGSRSEFPFPSYRKGQREMAVAVYNTIKGRKQLFCEAPTGIGKSLSVLFPALKAMSMGLCEKIFYLTAKTITRQAAENALNQLRKAGCQIRSVTFTAKDKICFLEQRACNPEACPYAKGYYDRINDHVFELLQTYSEFDREVLETEARNRDLCPFELAIDLAPWCDVIIADYNYLFDPVVALNTLIETNPDAVFLIDEAHNLVDRSRSMYSAQISKSPFLSLKKQLTKTDQPLYKALNKVNETFIDLRKKGAEKRHWVQNEMASELNEALTLFTYGFESWRKKNPVHPVMDNVLSLYFDVRNYLLIAEMYGDNYATMINCHRSDVTVQLMCLDASEILNAIFKKGCAGVLFSATLSPATYFKKVLGGEAAHHIQLSSPFDTDQFQILVADTVSTKYADRDHTRNTVAEMIRAFVAGKAGNYMIFFPSYAYLDSVLTLYEFISDAHTQILVQTPEMTEEAREDFLKDFLPEPDRTKVAFCITGGIFGEGIDLKGDKLIGAVIVGVGMPQLCEERDLLKDYYSGKGYSGFDTAYKNPGMIRVMQAMGRVIRDHGDRGMCLLIDERFSRADYRNLLPAHFKPTVRVQDPAAVYDAVTAFWHDR